MKIRILCLSLITLFKSFNLNAGNAPLTYNLNSTQIFYYSIETKGISYLSGVRRFAKSVFDVHFVVKDSHKTTIQMQVIIDRFQYKDSFDSFDTQTGLPVFSNMPPYFAYLIDKPIDFSISQNGECLSVEGINAMVDTISEKYYKKSFMEKLQIRQFINEEFFSSIISNVFLQYPIKNKDKWQVNIMKKINVPIIYNRKTDSQNQTIISGSINRNFSEKDLVNNEKNKVRSVMSNNIYKINPRSGLTIEASVNDKIEYKSKENGSYLTDSVMLSVKQQIIPVNNKTVTISGKIRNLDSAVRIGVSNSFSNMNNETLKIDSFTNKDGSFTFTRNLRKPIEILFFDIRSIGSFSVILQPGDSLCIYSDFNNWQKSNNHNNKYLNNWIKTFQFSGQGSLENNLFLKLQNRKFSWGLNEKPEDFKKSCLQEYKEKLLILDSFRDSLSEDTYKHIKSFIYSHYLNDLLRYYSFYKAHNPNPILSKPELMSMFFDDIDFSNCSSTSFLFRHFIYKYLFEKIAVIQHTDGPRNDQPQNTYYYAKLLFPNSEARYYTMALCVYYAIQLPGLNEAYTILEDFKRTYPESEFSINLQSMINQKADLSIGSIAPDFTIPDLDNKKITLSSFRGKWVLLFFQDENSDYFEHKKIVIEQIINKIPSNKFEIIWVLLSNKKEIIKHQTDYCKQYGTVLLNPEWKIPETKKYKTNFSLPTCLLSPDGKVEIEENFNIGKDFINQLIDTINNDNKKKETSTISIKAILWSFCILILVFTLVIFIYRRRVKMIHNKEIKLREKLDLELKAIRSQLNPHFMFNSLSSIQHLVNENKVDDANRYLSSFAGLMRKVLQQSDKELIPLENELDTVRHYLELEALRFRFNFDIEVESNVDIFNVEIPPLLLQPFVENAVIHGIAGMQENGKINIRVCKNTKQVKIVIEDNGVGFENSANADNSESNGKGLALTRKRMEIIKQNYANEMKFEIHDKANENSQGTKVEISFDLEK